MLGYAFRLAWSMMHHTLFTVKGTGKLLGKLRADEDNLSYVNFDFHKRTQSTLNVDTFSSNTETNIEMGA